MTYDGKRCPICRGLGAKVIGKKVGKTLGIIGIFIAAIVIIPFVISSGAIFLSHDSNTVIVSSISKIFSSDNKPIIKTTELEQKIHVLINEQRKNNGLTPLLFDSALADIARSHSQDMATRNYFEHDTPEGITFSDRYKQASYNCQRQFDVTPNSYMISEGGENIFQNNLYNSVESFNGIPSIYSYNTMDELANSTVTGWMHSEGHRHNILTPYYQNEGIGIAISSDEKVYVTEDFC